MQMMPKCPIRGLEDFAIWYTPGRGRPCRAIQADPDLVYEHTNKANTIAIVSDGTRVLGLGDIGPEAGLPVMEGKALLFKYLGGVDAVPLCLAHQGPGRVHPHRQSCSSPPSAASTSRTSPSPSASASWTRSADEMSIPVWHDDQQGTATVLLAGLLTRSRSSARISRRVRIAMIGMGAANVATYRLLKASGVDPGAIVACDSKGTLHQGRADIEERQASFADKWRVCSETNADGVTGGIAEALRGADVCIAFSASGPGIIKPEWVEGHGAETPSSSPAPTPCPRSGPGRPRRPGRGSSPPAAATFPTRSTTRSSSPAFSAARWTCAPGRITDDMATAAARELARFAAERGIHDDDILPRMDEWEVFPRVAAAAAMAAQAQGVARLQRSLFGAPGARGQAHARSP